MDVLTAPLPLTSISPSPTAGAAASVTDLLRTDDGVSGTESLGDVPAMPGGGSVAPAFGAVLNSFLQKVDASQHKADAMVESLALGEPVDVHQVMLSLNEATNALHLTMQVKSKILDAYQELMRMPL
jgi:flagellar hook-basal body complex protein FliE